MKLLLNRKNYFLKNTDYNKNKKGPETGPFLFSDILIKLV
ncbi:hypothetical protein VO54_02861 [Elizabethkingia miricola]|nr:hypothetical protein VO54_02861 [Elizabethkingia miricola]